MFPRISSTPSRHEWVRTLADGTVEIGITDHAQHALGDLVFVEVPDAGRAVKAGEACAVVESVKAASDVYAPRRGQVIAGNAKLAAEPETDQHGSLRRAAGSCACKPAAGALAAAQLLSAADYQKLLRRGGRADGLHSAHRRRRRRDARGHRRVASIEELFDEIPARAARASRSPACPQELNEMQIGRLMSERARRRRAAAVVSSAPAPTSITSRRRSGRITTRGEFYSAYTPYQAEASQGTLQTDLRIPDHDREPDRHGGRRTPRMYDGASARGGSLPHGGARQSQVEAPRASWCRAPCIRTTARWPWPPPATRACASRSCRTAPTAGVTPAAALARYDGRGRHRAGHPAAELLRRARGRRCAHRLGARARRAGDRGRQSDLARAAEAAGRSGARAAPTSSSATASRSACRCPPAARTSAS